ncbi:MAG: enolase C-terminal domain-like protein [Actinomycetota bacterium]
MTITSVEAIPYRLRARRPVRFANGQVDAAVHVLVRVRDSDGVEGVAEASPRPMTYGDTAVSVVHAIEQLIEPAVRGVPAGQIGAAHHRLRHLVHNTTAIAAFDVALWDLKARRLGVPLAEMLGGFATSVRAAHLLSLASPEEMAAEADEVFAATGVTAMKVKVGVDVATDVARTVAVRDALGAGALLYLDANHGWDAPATLIAVRALADKGIRPAWIEEPTPAAHALERRWLVERLDIPIVGDESATSLTTASAELQAGRCQAIAIKAGRTGITDSGRVIGLTEGLGADVVIGSQVEGTLGSIANLHLAAAHEATSRHPAEVTSGRHFETDIVTGAPPVEDGVMSVPTGPGLGVDIDDDALASLRLDT